MSLLPRFFRTSLLARTVALICLPLLVAVVIAVVAAISATVRDAGDALAGRARLMVEVLAGGAVETLWNLDDAAARELVAPLARDPDFLGLVIRDAQGAVFVALGDASSRPPGGVVVGTALMRHDWSPGQPPGQPLGTLEVRLTGGRAAALAAGRAGTIALAGAGLLAAVAGTLALIVRGVTQPVRAMTQAMGELAAGRTGVVVPAPSHPDEIGRMATALATLKTHAVERLAFIERQAHLMEEIERTVRQRTAELQQTQEELMRADRLAALGGMVAAMAHEINTPLGNSLTVATTLNHDIARFREALAGNEIRRSVLRGFSDSLEAAGRLLTGNLTRAAELIGGFKRVAVDQTSEQRRSFDLATVSGEVVAMLWPSYKTSGCRILVDIPPGIAIDGYPGALGQVLGNLVSNALIHAFDGVAPGTVRVCAGVREDGSILMAVSDDGRGIAGDDLPRVFDPFFTTRLGAGGSGLGLHIAYVQVCRVMGGRIGLASLSGCGTCFIMQLPPVAPLAVGVAQGADTRMS